MIKVRILDRCEFCDGEVYIFECEDVDARGNMFDRYRPCEVCHGSGNQAKCNRHQLCRVFYPAKLVSKGFSFP